MKPINENNLLGIIEKHYLAQDYAQAKDLLIENKEFFDPGHFYYNYGTLHAKMGTYPAARYHLEKSLKLGFINRSSLQNLEVVKSHLNITKQANVSQVDEVVELLVRLPGPLYLTTTLFSVLLVLILIKAKVVTKARTIIIVFLLCLGPILIERPYIGNFHLAIALEDVGLREGPSRIYLETVKVAAGTRLIVGRASENGWLFINYPRAYTGWIDKSKIAIY